MKRLAIAFVLVCAAVAGGSTARAASTLCVGGPHCFATIQAAVDAAHDGDTITIARGTFAGGATIDVSVSIRGAGAGRTIVKGGGPVVTIGVEQAATEPTVSISGVTITGGVNDSAPDHAVTQGGGVRIPQGQALQTGGATVTISDSVITGNEVVARQLLPPGLCGPFDCSFASGGGIFNAGALTLIRTRVSDNQAGEAGSPTTNADGGGIDGSGSLTMRASSVTGNRAFVTPPIGGGAVAGGIDAGGDTDIADSVVSGNSVEVTSTLPGDFELHNAVAGGLVIGGDATVTRTIVRGNSVTAHYAGGTALAVSGGIQVDGSLVLSDSAVEGNHVSSSVPAAADTVAIAAQGGLGVGGVATIRTSVVAANTVAADSPGGAVQVGGGGIGTFGALTLEKSLVAGNAATTNGAAGTLQGGGINNFSLGGPPPQLVLVDSVITGNRLGAGRGITPQGGGLHTDFPVTLTHTVIAGNRPDQCFGC